MENLFIVILFSGIICVLEAAPPTITSVPTPTLRSDLNNDASAGILEVTDPDGDSFACTVDSNSVPFYVNVNDDAASGGYLMTFAHSDPDTLTNSEYTVTVNCTDDTGESSTADVTVSISSNSPPEPVTAAAEIVTVDVSVTYLPHTVLHTISIFDPDGDSVTCTATPSAGFRVDSNDCTIRNNLDLRSLTLTSSEVIQIEVSDGINDPVNFQRTLSFINSNQAPVFLPLPSVITYGEDVTSTDTLTQFSVTDAQSFSKTFSVDSDASLFDFNLATGEVKLASGQLFDYDAGTRTFVITCVADDSFFQSTASVTLSITDSNDAPVLSPTSAVINVNEGLPSSLSAALPFVVTDEDGTSATSHTFSVLDGETYSNYFFFPSPHTPTLSNLVDLDREGNTPPYPLTIKIVATDEGGKTATAEVVVNIVDVNDNDPVFDTASLVMSSVFVGMPAGTSLGRVQATDTDEGTNQQIEYSLVTPSSHADLFNVDANGKVSLLTDLNEAYGTALSLEIEAKDKGSPSRSTTTVVTLDWNKPPVITNLPANADVPEDPTAEILLVTLEISDPENDLVACQVTDVNPSGTGSSSFVVRQIRGTSDQGVYYTGAEDLSFNVTASYDVTVTASDGNGGLSTGVLTVEVTPNTPPVSSCDGSDAATVNVQTVTVDTEVKTLTVTDPENDKLTFTFKASPDSGSFKFDEGTKRILVARDLRAESTGSHEMKISISDGHNRETCTVFITLTNMNLPPVFASHNAIVAVNENVAALTSLFKFTITDTETFSVRWTVDPLSDTGLFSFDDATYEIKLASGHSFDFETKTTTFVITCTTDDGFLQSSSSVTISINDVNDPPYFQANFIQVTVDEGPAPTVTFLPVYNVVDPDGDSLTYALVPGGTYTDLLAINSVDGTLTSRLTLDRDDGAPNPFSVQVEVKDPSDESVTVDVTIYLNDVNDNAPEFDQERYEFKVGLSSKNGDQLGLVTVTDKDDGNNALYDLVVVSQVPSGYLTLEEDGRLFLTKDLDVDYGTLLSLDVEARDRGTPSLTSTVVIDVVWNQGPIIHNLPTAAYIHENVETKLSIFSLSVTDPESDQYTCIRDQIVPNTVSFDIEDVGDKEFEVFYTGSGKLSASDQSKYEMTVRCYDGNGEASDTLIILLRSNAAPTLTCSPTKEIEVNAIDTDRDGTVYTIDANDAEQDPLEFSISSPVFYVEKYSGIIKASQSLRTVTESEYALTIGVTDPKHTTYCTLIIRLTNENGAPVFLNLPDTAEVPENTAAGNALFVISMSDSNTFEPNLQLTWSSPHKYMFDAEVTGSEATIKLNSDQTLDYESADKTFVLTFVASDGYLSSEEATLTIQLTPVNEAPYFDKDVVTYHATFLEVSSSPQVKALGCNVIDPDENDVVTLSLTGTRAHLFTIADLDNCQLTLTSEFDLDNGENSPATLTLIATDSQGEKVQATVIVTIEEVNDNDPKFDGPTAFTISTGMVAGDPIGSVNATDGDKGIDGDISYTIATYPLNEDEAQKYINFLSTGEFVLRQSMDGIIVSGENFEYVIRATDYGNPPRTATTTVNVVYDPFPNTTTTAPPNTTITTEIPSEESSLWTEPLVIGLLAGLLGLAAILGGVAICLACKYCGKSCSSTSLNSSSNESIITSRSSTPLKLNKISVVSMDSGYTPLSGSGMTGSANRKISALMPLPPAHY